MAHQLAGAMKLIQLNTCSITLALLQQE